jgi:hypothetical protein
MSVSIREPVQAVVRRLVMKATRFWIEILTLCAGVAFGLALALAIVGAAVVASGQTLEPQVAATPPSAGQKTYVGMVSCTRCVAKHSAKIGATASDCARVCIHDGARFTLVDGDQTYILEGNLAALKQAAGQRVRILGARKGATITVSSVSAET